MKELSTISLTTNQKRVLAKIIASPTPKVAGEEIQGDQNLVAARDQLSKLGMIQFVGGEASITATGEQYARDENITDESGQLTPDGEVLAYTSPSGKQQATPQQPPVTPPPGVTGTPSPGASLGMTGAPTGSQELTMNSVPKYERLSLLQELLKSK